jgi:GDP-D-mannose dehydratase
MGSPLLLSTAAAYLRTMTATALITVITRVKHLHDNASKARSKLGWRPRVGFRHLVEMMVDADLERVRREMAGG